MKIIEANNEIDIAIINTKFYSIQECFTSFQDLIVSAPFKTSLLTQQQQHIFHWVGLLVSPKHQGKLWPSCFHRAQSVGKCWVYKLTVPDVISNVRDRKKVLFVQLQVEMWTKLMVQQGCALREITRSPKFPNYEIQGAQHKAYMKEIRLSGRPKAKVSRLRHPGILRAQPCSDEIMQKQKFWRNALHVYL